MSIVTRFAPSPTGFLHIGGARTALFNWLYAKSTGGKFLLRIEDTDKERSTKESIDSIINSMKWLGLNWNEEIVYQSERADRHTEVAEELIKKGQAYYCYSTKEEIEEFRAKNPNKKFLSPWRNSDAPPPHDKPIVRLKVAREGETIIEDSVQGKVSVRNSELDDMVLLRSDKTPTYMLAVVVDDHDMGVNTIIRGDDHFTNTFRQAQIYRALGWPLPQYAHIPLIHGQDGAKLSKRHAALSVEAYKELGYLPRALLNYLLRLGWSYKDQEIFTIEEATKLFSLEGIGRSPSRFDWDKLNHINAHYINLASDEELMGYLAEHIDLSNTEAIVVKSLPLIKPRASTLAELKEQAGLIIKTQRPGDEKSQALLADGAVSLVAQMRPELENIEDWTLESLKKCCGDFANKLGVKKPKIMQSLRAVLLGNFNTPGILEVMSILGKEEVLKRISDNTKY